MVFTPQLRKDQAYEDIKMTNSYDLQKNSKKERKLCNPQLSKPYSYEEKKNFSDNSIKINRKTG